MNIADTRAAGFIRLGPMTPSSPVVLAVPHAGRDYPAPLLGATALPVSTLAALEDRFADRLIADAVAAGATAFVALRARAWIDLNRDEREIDPAMVDPPPRPADLLASARVRGGLGLIPRRVGGADIWRKPIALSDVADRIARDHRPWHEAIAAALNAAHACHGIAILLDCHSMPPIPAPAGTTAPRVVLGDRHGRSASAAVLGIALEVAGASGLPAVCNAPYAGGHTLDRHGRPEAGIHALQIEIDRSIYLESDLRTPGTGLKAASALVARIAAALAGGMIDAVEPLAAE